MLRLVRLFQFPGELQTLALAGLSPLQHIATEKRKCANQQDAANGQGESVQEV